MSIFLSTAGSSSVAGDLLSRLGSTSAASAPMNVQHGDELDTTAKPLTVGFALLTSSASVFLVLFAAPCLPSLCIVQPCVRYKTPSIFDCQDQLDLNDLPKSLILYTPAALELALRCPLTIPLSSGGDDDKPEMAESTLVRGSTVSADIVAVG